MNIFYLIKREILNWLFLKRIIKQEKKKNNEWSKFNLRSNWYGRIYTIVSLREQDMGEEESVRNWKAMEMMRPINEYLTSLDVQEIIFPSIEHIPNSRSYLIVYSPIFNKFNLSLIIRTLIVLVTLSISAYIIFKSIY